MARRGNDGGPNKSQSIRDYIKAHKRASPSVIQKALADAGIDVSLSLVSAVKYKKKGKGKKRGRPAGSGAAAATNGRAARASKSGEKVAVDSLIAVKNFIKEVGNIEAATHALKVYSRIQP